MSKKLMRSRTDVKFSGVCSGIAKYLGVDVTIIRLIWVVLSIPSGFIPGLMIYFVFALIMPVESDVIDMRERDDSNNYN